ncbi:MAG: MBL fold metallo-hydrolase [Hymenobacter sp.]
MNPAFIHAANPGPMTGDGNWTYLIGRSRPVLIDAGVGHASHLDAIANAVRSGPSHVVVTHAHSDHISGAPAIHQRWPRTIFQNIRGRCATRNCGGRPGRGLDRANR